MSAGSGGGRRRTLPVKTRGIMFGDLPPIPTDPALDPPPKACYNCWQGGHSCLRCPRTAGVYCHNCGRRGADLTVCPRCSVAHRAYLKNRFGRKDPRMPASHRQGVMATATTERETGSRDRRASAVAATVELPAPRRNRSTERQQRREVAIQPTQERRNEPSGEPAVAAARVAPVPAVPVPQPEVNPERSATSPVEQALRLMDSLRDLPLEIRSAVLRGVFRNGSGAGPEDRQ